MDIDIIQILKDLIEKEGPIYIEEHPYEVYKTLIESSSVDRQVAGGFLLCILNGILPEASSSTSTEALTSIISDKCSLSDKISVRLSSLLISLYSPANQARWTKDEQKGLRDFLLKETEYSWNGFSSWEAQNIYIDCHYEASFVLKPSSLTTEDSGLRELMDRNPFLSCDKIKCYFEGSVKEYLDDSFEYYCNAEEYYEPVPQDFECEDYLNGWCKKHGFTIISFKGEGHNDGIQPLR